MNEVDSAKQGGRGVTSGFSVGYGVRMWRRTGYGPRAGCYYRAKHQIAGVHLLIRHSRFTAHASVGT